MRHSRRQIRLHRLLLAGAKNIGANRGGDEHQPHECCRRGADEAIEVVPVAYDRCQIGFHIEIVQPFSAILRGCACKPGDLPAQKVLLLAVSPGPAPPPRQLRWPASYRSK